MGQVRYMRNKRKSKNKQIRLMRQINGIPNLDDSVDLTDCLGWPPRLHVWNAKDFRWEGRGFKAG